MGIREEITNGTQAPSAELARRVAQLERQVAELEKDSRSSRVTTNVPTSPAAGLVYDVGASKLWVTTAAGVRKGVVLS